MPVETRMWEIDGDELRSAESSKLDKEELLQTWLEEDISILDEDLLVIGREETTDLRDRLDLLAIDHLGQLVVIELKRGDTPRKVVAQVLGYTAWAAELTYNEIEDIAREYFGDDTDLADAFQAAFGEDLPDLINESQRMIVVAGGLDPYVERSLRYLSEEWGVDINAVFFRCFENPDGDQWLVRTWLEEPSEVERRKRSSGGWTGSTMEELRSMAEATGAATEFDLLLEYAEEWGLRTYQAKVKLSLRGHWRGQWRRVFGMYPDSQNSGEGRLSVGIVLGRVVKCFEVDEEELQGVLPKPRPDNPYLYDMSSDDIERLAEFIQEHQA